MEFGGGSPGRLPVREAPHGDLVPRRFSCSISNTECRNDGNTETGSAIISRMADFSAEPEQVF